MKQIKIDNGQIGGTITIVMNSMFIFNLITFVNTCAISYELFLHRYVSLEVGFTLMLIGSLSWFMIYYCIIYPSIIRFANRQAYLHDSPIQKDLEEIKKMLNKKDNN